MRIEKNTSEKAHVNERQVSLEVKETADLTDGFRKVISTSGKGSPLLNRVSPNSGKNLFFK